MPVISRFYGIVVSMYFNDHNPPHLHARYSGQEGRYDFAGTCVEGWLPARADKLIREWITMHRSDLEQNWECARNGFPLNPVAPLE